MSIYSIKPTFQKILMPIAEILHKNKISATTVNLTGTVISLSAGVTLFLAPNRPHLYLYIPLLLFIRIASNALDGMVARLNKESSSFGAFLNEYLDRINDFLIIGGIVVSGVANPIIAAIAFVITPLISISGTLPQAYGSPRIYTGIMGKPDRMIVIGVASIASYFFTNSVWDIAFATIIVGGILTIFARFNTVIKELA